MKEQIIIGDKTFKSISELEKYTRSILTTLNITHSVKLKNEEFFNFLYMLCKRHPHHEDKLKDFKDFKICQNILNKKTLALKIINNDNTFTEISWLICVKGKCKTNNLLFNSALRQCISYQIKEFKNNSDLSYCRECKISLIDTNIHIDHHEIQFIQLVETFMELNKNIIIPLEYNKHSITFLPLFKEEDIWIGKLFEEYHLLNATLRVLCQTCNLTRTKYKNIKL